MRQTNTNQHRAIEGYFRRGKPTNTGRLIFGLALVLGILITILAVIEQQPLAIIGAVVGVILVGIIIMRRQKQQLVSVRFDNGKLTVYGGGYHIQMQAPFRYQTGIQRIRGSRGKPDMYYVRMVLDVYGKPLVFEEKVLPTTQPPKLDEISGLSSALGIAELFSLKVFPGTLWAIIEGIESMSSQSQRDQIQRDIAQLYRIGESQIQSHNYYGAIQTFSEIVRLTPESPYPYYNRGMAYYHYGGNHRKAMRDLTTVIRLDPKFHKAYRLRGLVRVEQQDWAGLRDDLTDAIRLNPNDSELYNIRGGACYRLQDYQSALADFDRAITLQANNPESYHNRGLVKHRQGDLDGAIADFRQALQLNPSFAIARESLSQVEQTKRESGVS